MLPNNNEKQPVTLTINENVNTPNWTLQCTAVNTSNLMECTIVLCTVHCDSTASQGLCHQTSQRETSFNNQSGSRIWLGFLTNRPR